MIIMGRKRSSPMNVLSKWVKKQSMRMKISLWCNDFTFSFGGFEACHSWSQRLLHWLRIHPCFGDHCLDLQTHHQKDLFWYMHLSLYTCTACLPFINFKITRSCCCWWFVLSSALNYLLLFSSSFFFFLRNIYLFKLSTYLFRFHMLFGEFII